MTLFSSFFISLLVSMLLVPPLVRLSAKLGLVDVPDDRKVHEGVIPRSGGIAIAAGALAPLLIWWPDETLLRALTLGALVIFVFGVLDDQRGLHYAWKFFGQLLAAGIVVGAGLRIEIVPFMGIDPVSAWLSIPLTIVFIVGVTNAINLSDGLDGLAAGTSLVALAAIAWMFFQVQAISLALITLATLGGVCGFLRYNNHPAVIFMGDTGSQFLGFVTAALAIILTQRTNPALNPALLLLLLGLPILDTLTVMVWRIRRGRSPFLPDRNHFHHRLLDFGFYHYEAVSVIYVAQAVMVAAGFVLRYESDVTVVGTYVLLSALIVGGFRVARILRFNVHSAEADGAATGRQSALRRRFPRLPHFVVRLTEIMVGVLLLLAAFYPTEVTRDFALLSLALAAFAVLSPFLPSRLRDVSARLSIYLAGVAAILAFVGESQIAGLESGHVNAVFLIVGAFLLGAIRMTGRDQFRTTPLDFLVVIFVLVVVIGASMQADSVTRFQLADTAIRLAVFFYASEFLCRPERPKSLILPICAVFSLSVLAGRGLF
ncbi:MAG: glycosyltransferase family 4 protein [Gammaproteobacteria bacterium]